MNRKERTEQKMQELFHSHAAGEEGTDGAFMQILQGYIFGDVCYTGSLDNRMRELVTVTVLTTLGTLPQLKAHVQASLNAGCTPVEIREAVYQCAPFIGFPKTLNAISTMNEVFAGNNIELPLPSQRTLTGENEEERYQRGLAIQAPLYGDEIAGRYTWLPGEFAQAVPRFLTELCFGDFVTRTGLDGKTRELLTVVLLAALGGAELQVKSHVQGALKAGNTKEEVVCALTHASGYLGIPRLFNALNACKDLLQRDE
ncbi:MAG TPA: carboxymuconolactone decarboxylase family protein [Candidatus Anaerotruncus excrementipullorum]|uniref:Carboxymuconolactone decarboxylase family protein n=1 Tax=Candidatus Anaerotruncus excrementipullorum TaxID=2838465 RepID=A0A9D1WSK3_9FIRM|nr:carboxymuconolactone decarboxylase family protein [Candidatus Anaerotruncus excrementipullorum]